MKNLFRNIKEKFLMVGAGIRKGLHVMGTPFRKLRQTKGVKAVLRVIRIPIIGHLLLACILNFVLEILSRHSVGKAIAFVGKSPIVFLYNAFIIFVTLSLVQFAKRKVFATIFVSVIWIISAFANYIVLSFRTTPFSAIDILMIRNVMTMLDKYMTKWQMVLSVIGIILVILLLIYLYIRLPKSKNKRNPFRASAYVCVCAVLIVTLTRVAVNTRTVSDNFGNLAYAYNDYGFAYCFSNSIIDTGISKPKNYSEELVKEIVAGLEYDKSEVVLLTQAEEAVSNMQEAEGTETGDTQTAESEGTEERAKDSEVSQDEANLTGEAATGEQTEESSESPAYYKNEPATTEYPNIIVIQLESIFDTKYMKGFYASENPMPTLARLKRRYSSGLFTVPAVGAGTANTEFEVQTGMSTQFFGAGEYPFKTIMRSVTCDSMAYDLKRLGYATAGFHNNDATFYERHVDYFHLGFDSFSGMEHMYNLNYTPRGWAKDDVLDDLMVERMRQTEGRDYITTITVQAHGRYPKKFTKTMTDIDCYFTGQYAGDKEKQAAWRYYINMCKETDNMIRDLVTKLEKLEEPTVLFMYGDHLPSLNLEESDLDGITLYQTEWVMWDNFGLQVEKRDMTAYQASTYIFDRLNLPGGLMQQFHNRYRDRDDQADYLSKLEVLEYDTLYGNHYAYDGENPFPVMESSMGIRDITLKSYEIIGDEVWLYGNGFNPFSVVYVDGKSVETTFGSYTILRVPLNQFENGTEVYVAQAGDDHLVLSVTDPIPIGETADVQ
ncbi:MAG: LTA synthase family protein [Lachnospiraceae bacterium]|nr:LTA synthase family protein [Lachnospiraceae bacterium]